MSWFDRLRNTARDERLARDIDREMHFHIEERAEELRRAGMSEHDALLEARRRFGNRSVQNERTRDADTLAWLDSLRGDLRYALRAMRRSPVFTLVAVASLALGIGANTAIYTLIDAVMVRPLPVPHPEELVRVTTGLEDGGSYFTNPLWEQIRDRQTALVSIAAFSANDFDVAERGESRKVRGAFVSAQYFTLFGVHPAIGRLFSTGDDVRGCPPTAVLSESFWRSAFNSADVVGKTISLEGKPFQIIGVASGAFTGPQVGTQLRVYVPLCTATVVRSPDALDARSRWWLQIMGRRSPDVPLEQASAGIASLAPGAYAATVPLNWSPDKKAEFETRKLAAFSATTGISALRTRYSKALLVLMGAVAIVLLIACANVANLLLARGTARQREVAIRLAIGAARGRLVRQLLTESAVLALIGAAIGLLVAHGATNALIGLISTDTDPVTLDLAANLRVLSFTALVATLTIMAFGLIPAWRGTRIDPQSAMKAGGRGIMQGGGHARFTIGKALVAAQVALTLILLVGAGLLVGSLRNLATLDPGFRADGVLIVNTDLRRSRIPRDQIRQVRQQLLDRLRATPGVRTASTTDQTPASGSSWNEEILVSGFTPKSADDALSWFNEVSSGYFATMGTRLLAGRDFDASDVPGAAKTAIVSEAAARHFFGTTSALGKQFRTKGPGEVSDPYTIVGIVADSKYIDLREQESPIVYLPETQAEQLGTHPTFLVRVNGDAAAVAPSVRTAINGLLPAAMLEFRPLSRQIAASLRRERLLAVLSALFSSVALLLSVLGLYGVMSYAVARRRNEIGVRIALGAARQRVVRMVLGDVARVVTIGVALGAAGALAGGKLVQSFLYGLEPADPVVLVLATVVLAVVALLAGYIPARRAAAMDPVAALREE